MAEDPGGYLLPLGGARSRDHGVFFWGGWHAVRRVFALGVGVTIPAAAWAQATPPRPTRLAAAGGAGRAIVLDGVTIIDVKAGRRLRDQRLVITGNRIRAIGATRTVRVPPGARVISARGKALIPGLWDLHVHPATDNAGAGREGLYHLVKAAYSSFIANGVTGIRDANASVPLDSFRIWKQQLAARLRIGPRLIVVGPAIDGPCENPGFTSHICIAGPADARRVVDSLKAAGADMLKLYALSVPTFFAVAAEARRVGLPFGGHVSWDNEKTDPTWTGRYGLVASDSGARILDHELWTAVCGHSGSNGADTTLSLRQCAAAAARLRRNNTWVPTIQVGGPSAWGGLPDSVQALWLRTLRYAGTVLTMADSISAWHPLTAAERQRRPTFADFQALASDSFTHSGTCQSARLAYAADLPLAPGTDWPLMSIGPAGAGVHEYLLTAVLCGVPPLWALRTATLNPARAVGLSDSLGTVAVGKVADLVLLEGDPLEDIWNVSKIAAVVANGRYFDRAALDRLLVESSQEWQKIAMLEQQRRQREAAKQSGPKP